MSSGLPSVTVVIPNYNGQRLLGRNLPHVQAAVDVYPGSCQVIVVDDASTEPNTAAFVRGYPGVQFIQHETNQGFAATLHTGVQSADTELLMFLNSDVAPDEDVLIKLAPLFEDQGLFAASPVIVDESGALNRYAWNRRHFHRGRLQDLPWDLVAAQRLAASKTLFSLFASGGSMMVRKSMFLALDGFSDIYAPFYVEDLDLCVRAWRNGWKTVFEPTARVVHQEVGSIRENVDRHRIKRIQRRNGFVFEWTHLSRGRLFGYRLPYYLKQSFGRLLRGDWDYLGGLGAALSGLPRILANRRRCKTLPYKFEDVLQRVNAGVE